VSTALVAAPLAVGEVPGRQDEQAGLGIEVSSVASLQRRGMLGENFIPAWVISR
jgi:hypothetical protein